MTLESRVAPAGGLTAAENDPQVGPDRMAGPNLSGWQLIGRLGAAGLLGAAVVTCVLGGVLFLTSAQSPRAEAQSDADRMLALIAPGPVCAAHCSAVVSRIGTADAWQVELATSTWKRCFRLEVSAFGYTRANGVHGIREVPCSPS